MRINKRNNFDILRLIFATFVVVCHSFWINGKLSQDPLNLLSNQQIDLGSFGVKCFFILSGFLVFKSLERSNSILHYLSKRWLRIYPALIGLSIFTLCIIPFIYENKTPLWENKQYLLLLPKTLLLFHEDIHINGVFDHHPKRNINLSLWTLSYEVSCYLLLGLLFFIKKRYRLLILSLSFIASWYLACFKYYWLNENIFELIHLKSYYFYDFICLFIAGALLTHIDFNKIKFRFFWITLNFLILIIGIKLNIFYYIKYFTLPTIVLLIGAYPKGRFINISSKIGDLSYGIYIYGWFIQQILFHYFQLNEWTLSLTTLPIVYILAWLSWVFIEKKALRIKQKTQ